MAETDRLLGRNGDIWRLYCQGHSSSALAARFGISDSRVRQIIKEVRDSIPEERREDVVIKSLDLMNQLLAGAMEIYESAGTPVLNTKTGEYLTDPVSGEYVRDVTGKLRAADTALKTVESVRRMLGVDAAAKLDVSGGEEAATRAAAEAALAKLAGE